MGRRLKKAKRILFQTYWRLKAKKAELNPEQKKTLARELRALESKVEKKQREAYQQARKVDDLCNEYMPKSAFEQMRDFCVMLVGAVVIALLFRLMVAELYTIPSGSMRPTLKEADKLLVSKSQFGINVPLRTKHFTFDPAHVKRGGIVVFTGEGMDIDDVQTNYFYLIPGYKQYVKRMIGLPGDTLYFYGGKIYGMDRNGNDISPLLQRPEFSKIDHIPFASFEGKVKIPEMSIHEKYSHVDYYQMNHAVASLFMTSQGQIRGKMRPLGDLHQSDAPPITQYSDLWGFKNYGEVRLVTRAQVEQFTGQHISELGIADEEYYAEVRHHPRLSGLKFTGDARGRMRPTLGLSKAYIPLGEEQLRTLFQNLYTARFIVENGFARRYGAYVSPTGKNPFLPRLPGLPDGTYEFYYGKAYKIGFGGVAKELPANHPIYTFTPERIHLLFNLGIEFDNRYAPVTKAQIVYPSRYAYFRDGALYMMGAPLLSSGSKELRAFNAVEEQKQNASLDQKPYHAFRDYGAPYTKEGNLDKVFLAQFGIQVPAGKYLVLGDNHAMSGDSRLFGCVPEENLRGVPDWIIWPPGKRLGSLDQPKYPLLVGSRMVMWSIVGLALFVWWLGSRKRHRLPLELPPEHEL